MFLEGKLVISKENDQTSANEQNSIRSPLKKQSEMLDKTGGIWGETKWICPREGVLRFRNIYELKIQQKASVLCVGLSGLFG